MADATTIARTYLQAWNETDAERRAKLLRESWSDDAHYIDPLMNAAGLVQIDGLIGAVHERFAGFRFALRGQPDGHGEHVRFGWSLGPAGVEAPIEGSDVLELEHGRIRRVIGFLDKVPASA
jgi:SnoaL-like domain